MRRILIVEPKPAEAQALKDALREAGLTGAPTVVKGGVEARRLLVKRNQHSVVLLDLHTGDGSAMEFLEWLRQQHFYHELLVIAVGERSQLRTVVEACERGAHTFVIKPVHEKDMKKLARAYPGYWA